MSIPDKTSKVYIDSIPFVPYGRAMALGFFDGVHIGHSRIIAKMVKTAKKNGLRSTVQTFANFPKGEGRMITTLEERLDILSEMGVDEMFVLDFNAVKDHAPEFFLEDIIRNKLNAKALFCGEDHRFGKNAGGDGDLLRTFGEQNDIAVKIFKDETLPGNDRRVSSSWVRECLESGDVALARKLMGGRAFSYSGMVVRGKQLGRKLGFPTVNLEIPEDKVIVRRGVYVSRITVGAEVFFGVTNVGRRPTVEEAANDIAETYIFDFDEDIYGARIKVELIDHIRDEKKFKAQDELMAEVEANKAQAKTYLQESGII